MFQRILNSIAGDYNQRQINKLLPYIKTINDFDAQFDALTDDQIKAKTPEFIARYGRWDARFTSSRGFCNCKTSL